MYVFQECNLSRRYPRKYNFLGFSIRPVMREINGRNILMPGTFVSISSKKAIRRMFSEMEIHKKRKPIEALARELNPIIEGIIQYFHKFWEGGMRDVWNQLNHRLLKWVKWEKGLYKYASLRWLQRQYKVNPQLFGHWRLVQPWLCLVSESKNMKSRMKGDFHVRFRSTGFHLLSSRQDDSTEGTERS